MAALHLRNYQNEPDNKLDLESFIHSESSFFEEGEDTLFCFLCGRPITRVSECIERGGHIEHSFTNPGGYTFHISCFRRAACLAAEEYTAEYSWFSEYSWCYALCASCRSHLGWRYRARETDYFYGLIRDRLIGYQEKQRNPGKN